MIAYKIRSIVDGMNENTAICEERMFKVTGGDEDYRLVTRDDIVVGATGIMACFRGKNIDRVVNRLWYDGYDVEEVGCEN